MQSMKKKIYFITFIAIGVLGFIFSFGNVVFASVPSCDYSVADANTLSGSALRTFYEAYSACMGHLPFQCLAVLGPNSEIQGNSCGCKAGYIQDDRGQCSLSQIQPAQTVCSNGYIIFSKDVATDRVNFKSGVCYQLATSIWQACGADTKNKTITYKGTCACENGFVFYGDQCITPAEKTAKETEVEKNKAQCLISRGENAEYKNSWCGCKNGYQTYATGKCQTATEACQTWYGMHSKSTTENTATCTCEERYVLSGKQCVPLAQPVSVTPSTIPPPAIVLPSPIPIIISKPIAATPTKKKPQPSIESEIKIPAPTLEITASTTNPQETSTSRPEPPEIATPAPPAPIVKQENIFQRVWRKFWSWF
jgi:hypothetical protein